jgi:hypothetical protein
MLTRLLCVLTLVVYSGSLYGQSTFGSITGTATDKSGPLCPTPSSRCETWMTIHSVPL